MGKKIGAVSFLEILAPELNDRMLADILDLETGVIVNLHIRSIDQTEAIKTIKRKMPYAGRTGFCDSYRHAVSVYHIPTLCAPGIQKFYLWIPLQLFYLSAGENMLYWDVDLSETKFHIYFTAR